MDQAFIHPLPPATAPGAGNPLQNLPLIRWEIPGSAVEAALVTFSGVCFAPVIGSAKAVHVHEHVNVHENRYGWRLLDNSVAIRPF